MTPGGDDEIGALIGGLASNRELWIGRIRAGHELLAAQEDVSEGPVTAAGYCFGGASVLEYVRTGGVVAGAVSIHGGLDLVSTDWTGANADAAVLILTGAEDPMSPPPVVAAIEDAMTTAGISWEVSSYGQAKHAFTNSHADKAGRPDVLAYDARADRRSWRALMLFLEEMLESAGSYA
jgi:dienelactone hydrolase